VLISRRAANVLLVTCGWTLFVWIVAVKNLVVNQHTTAFRVVHAILAAVSLGLGLAVGVIGWRARKGAATGGS
jgi:hypothetical protein